MKKPTNLLFLLAFAVFSQNLAAAMYKWVDEQGNTHYSQYPPSSKQYEAIAPPPPPSSSAAEEQQKLEALRKTQAETNQARSQAEQEAAAKAAEQERFRKNCETARNNLQTYSNLGRRMLRGDDGVAYYPSQEELAEKKAQAQRQIQEFCK